jgi:hypothetical protein
MLALRVAGMSTTEPKPRQIIVPYSLESVLDEFIIPIRNRGLAVAQNVVYQRQGGYGKRTGSAPYGSAVTTQRTVGDGLALSGKRWYRGMPSFSKVMIAQTITGGVSTFYTGDDVTGAWTSLGATPGSLGSGATPAFYTSSYDAVNSGGSGPSDVLVIAHGGGPPVKYDGTHFTRLSSTITNPFRGCEFFNEHIFFWGDPTYPDIVFATDLATPETYDFCNNFGGYKIGRGDGDPVIQRCIAIGTYLIVFKTQSVKAITGYDFYTGQFAFQVSDVLTGIGTTAPRSVARLRNSLIWWSGNNFYRMGIGDTEATAIGTPIPRTIAVIAQGDQSCMRAVAGDFLVQSADGWRAYNNVYIVACETGGKTTVLLYDELKSYASGKPAWTVWTGLEVGALIPWNGPTDQKSLYFSQPGGVYLLGGDSYADVWYTDASGVWGRSLWGTGYWGGAMDRAAIPVALRTGRSDNGTPNQTKHLDRIFVDAETNTTVFNVAVVSDSGASPMTPVPTPALTPAGIWGRSFWGTGCWGVSAAGAYVGLEAPIMPNVDGNNFYLDVAESSSTSAYEVVALGFHAVEEAIRY